MQFYRPLAPISALTFDLDDTLYDNQPVMDRTRDQSLAFVRRYHPALRQFDDQQLQQWRQRLRESEPEIYHDVTEWRRRALALAMQHAGLSTLQATAGADAAMAHFASWRSQITVPPATHRTLTALAEKWPLAAITNGNAQPENVVSLAIFVSFYALARMGVLNRLPICFIWLPASWVCHSARYFMWVMI